MGSLPVLYLDIKQNSCTTPGSSGKERIRETRRRATWFYNPFHSPWALQSLGVSRSSSPERPRKEAPRPLASPHCRSACSLQGHPHGHHNFLPHGLNHGTVDLAAAQTGPWGLRVPHIEIILPHFSLIIPNSGPGPLLLSPAW